MISPRVTCFDVDGNRVWESADSARVEITARFGAEDSEATVVLDSPDNLPEASPGDGMEIRFDGQLKFRGQVSEMRTHSASWPLVLHGMRHPRRKYNGEIRGLFEQETPTEILSAALGLVPGEVPNYGGSPASSRMVDRLDFQGVPLFYAVDLLAKLAGNWLWRLDWDENLVFIPPDTEPERIWSFDPDRMVLHPGLRDQSVKNRFVFFGGVSGGSEYVRYFESPESRDRFGAIEERLFARSITTEAAFSYLRDAVLEQLPGPVDVGMVERFDGDLSASFGERFELRGNPLVHLDEDQVFRIAAEEIRWTPQAVSVRYHLAEGLESATRYGRYIDHDPAGTSFVAAHLGPFTLDLSALDSEAHLDS